MLSSTSTKTFNVGTFYSYLWKLSGMQILENIQGGIEAEKRETANILSPCKVQWIYLLYLYGKKLKYLCVTG